jgi:hypothetical protein
MSLDSESQIFYVVIRKIDERERSRRHGEMLT